jgi:hypothetical protein
LVNGNTVDYASWTFRSAPKFFDVRAVSHTFGSDTVLTFPSVGMACVKRYDTTANWNVKHRSLSSGSNALLLNGTNAEFSLAQFSITGNSVTISGASAVSGDYLVLVWAHDDSASGIIQFGSFTTDGSGNATVSLPWNTQWFFVKRADGTQSWFVVDSARGNSEELQFNTSEAEGTALGSSTITIGANSFSVGSLSANADYIFGAIKAES